MLKRSPIKKKKKKTKVSWRSGKIRLDAKGMKDLRLAVYVRSCGGCENAIDGKRCDRHITWENFEMHHLRHRSLSGSDTMLNCIALDKKCHSDHHLRGTKIVPYWFLLKI